MTITFCALDLDITNDDRQKMYEEVMNTDQKHWHYNDFRGCYMLPVLNSGGQLGEIAEVKREGSVTRNLQKIGLLLRKYQMKKFSRGWTQWVE